MDNTKKFSGRAENYTKGRPGYPQALIDSLYNSYGFSADCTIADIGAGTGKFSRPFLEMGSIVYLVEPNDDMRITAEKELSIYKNAIFINGSADMTGLDDCSVNFVTAAQAFHWFDADKFKNECKRILKPDGKVILVWNTRDMSSDFNIESYEVYRKYCPEFKGYHGGMKDDDQRIFEFFNNSYEKSVFENPVAFTKDRFITRSLSASYSLKSGDNNFDNYIRDLETVFDKFSKNDVVIMKNNTTAYIGTV
ncbi:MAG: class I SAM-dependent methyltransferase [Acetobacter sp.]|nr:class I SAM-dependent methyltransferase [Bacteroides sp.]MCM1341291.1 class I SAM-dependent methyltransferase [Acetobacter sp.]MCM1433933.1 class I SAM-dependent methyltransferase [Clostridiales bacterium]